MNGIMSIARGKENYSSPKDCSPCFSIVEKAAGLY